MIWESDSWKEALLKSRDYLARVQLSSRASERTFMRIEKEVFFGFYSIRKLLDTYKVSTVVKKMQFDLMVHKTMRRVDYMNWHQLKKNCDLSAHTSETREIRYLCNQFIHSYVFLISQGNGRISGFFVASDRERHRKVYFVKLCHVLSAFRAVGKDSITQVYLQRNKGGQWSDDV